MAQPGNEGNDDKGDHETGKNSDLPPAGQGRRAMMQHTPLGMPRRRKAVEMTPASPAKMNPFVWCVVLAHQSVRPRFFSGLPRSRVHGNDGIAPKRAYIPAQPT